MQNVVDTIIVTSSPECRGTYMISKIIFITYYDK